MAEMLVRYAGVNPKDIKGMRAPFLAVGGDTMFRMLNRYGLYYDSSMSVPNPSWPYTLDYKLPHTCAVKPCPKLSHPGMSSVANFGDIVTQIRVYDFKWLYHLSHRAFLNIHCKAQKMKKTDIYHKYIFRAKSLVSVSDFIYVILL